MILADEDLRKLVIEEVECCLLKFTGLPKEMNEIISGKYFASPDCISCDTPVFYKPLTTKSTDFRFAAVFVLEAKIVRSTAQFNKQVTSICDIATANKRQFTNDELRWHLAFTNNTGVAGLPRRDVYLVGPVATQRFLFPVTFPVAGTWTLSSKGPSVCGTELSRKVQCERTIVKNAVGPTPKCLSAIRDKIADLHAASIGMNSSIIQLQSHINTLAHIQQLLYGVAAQSSYGSTAMASVRIQSSCCAKPSLPSCVISSAKATKMARAHYTYSWRSPSTLFVAWMGIVSSWSDLAKGIQSQVVGLWT